MSFGPHHYVPVLKIKRGEKRALQAIPPAFHARITPLLEIVERNAETHETVSDHLDNAFHDLADSVRPYSRCFLDTREIYADGPAAVVEVFHRADAAGIRYTPVTGISRPHDFQAAVDHGKNGIALRLTLAEAEGGGLESRLLAFMAKNRLTPEVIDLIVDLGPIEDRILEGVKALIYDFLAQVPWHDRWRTFTLSACAFPKSMGEVERNSYRLVERTEWIAWRDYLHAICVDLVRLPTFSDCAIQHPAGVEGFDFRIMQVSAAIRYTLSDDWLIMKGVSTQVTPPSVQFPNLADQLVHGLRRSQFFGANHCPGCAGMHAAANHAPGFGAAEVWRRLGTIHHITMVMQGLAALPWP